MERTPKCHFVPGFPPEIPKIRIPVTLEAHNLVCKSSIEVRFKTNFYFLLRAFQRYVARHLHTRKSRRFQLLMVESQIGNLTFSPSFGHNLCFKYSNGSCNPILDTYVLRNFQWYKELFNPMSFDPYNCLLKIHEFIGTPTPKVWAYLGVWGFIPSHSLAFSGAWNVSPGLTFGSHFCKPLLWLWNPRLRLRQTTSGLF
jgi:hypothetical protein